jgi:hypothetical protein
MRPVFKKVAIVTVAVLALASAYVGYTLYSYNIARALFGEGIYL